MKSTRSPAAEQGPVPRRLLPTFVILGLGFVALGWGLVSLQRIFAQEREDARAQLRSRRETLEHYAEEALRQTLSRQMAASVSQLHAAMEDPLAPAEGFYLTLQGHQFLPRLTRPKPGAQAPARRYHEQLLRDLAAPASVGTGQERLAMLRAVEAAFTRNDAPRAGTLLEELLRHRADHPLPPDQELSFTLLLIERLERGPATPWLVRALLREGLPDDLGGIARGAGLQRELLRKRPRLTQADFDFLSDHVVRLSVALGEPVADFQARVRESGSGALVMPDDLDRPTLIGERWYVEPHGEDIVRGIAVRLEDLLQALTRDMRERGLTGAGDRVRLASAGAVLPLESLRLEVDMPGLAAAEAAIEQRYGLKTALVATCAALAAAIVVLAGLIQHRRYRFVELKSDFVATVSHELRTPLASIRLLAETLERRLAHASVPEVRDYPARIVQAADGLHFLVENILSFNRIDKGRWAPRTSRVRLDELVATLRSDLTDVLGASGAPVRLTADVGDVELEVDPSLMRLLLSNLGRNACAYNRRSPVEIAIRVHARDGACTVLFGDNGIGIPESEWEAVFRDFYRLSPPGLEVHGSGLGLALCRRIMDIHGGRIRVATSSPEGTTFALTFPEPRR